MSDPNDTANGSWLVSGNCMPMPACYLRAGTKNCSSEIYKDAECVCECYQSLTAHQHQKGQGERETRQSVACNAMRHPVVEHQDTCTYKHYYNSLLK